MRGVGPLLMLPSLADASGQEYHQMAKSPFHLLRPHTPPSTFSMPSSPSSHSIFPILHTVIHCRPPREEQPLCDACVRCLPVLWGCNISHAGTHDAASHYRPPWATGIVVRAAVTEESLAAAGWSRLCGVAVGHKLVVRHALHVRLYDALQPPHISLHIDLLHDILPQ